MVTATEAPAVEEPAAQPVVADAPPEPRPTNRLTLVGIVVGVVVVACALFGGGILVGMNIDGGTGTTQNQFGPGNGQFRQGGGFPGGQNGGTGTQNGGGFGQNGTQNGGQNGFGPQGGQQGAQQQGSSNS